MEKGDIIYDPLCDEIYTYIRTDENDDVIVSIYPDSIVNAQTYKKPCDFILLEHKGMIPMEFKNVPYRNEFVYNGKTYRKESFNVGYDIKMNKKSTLNAYMLDTNGLIKELIRIEDDEIVLTNTNDDKIWMKQRIECLNKNDALQIRKSLLRLFKQESGVQIISSSEESDDPKPFVTIMIYNRASIQTKMKFLKSRLI